MLPEGQDASEQNLPEDAQRTKKGPLPGMGCLSEGIILVSKGILVAAAGITLVVGAAAGVEYVSNDPIDHAAIQAQVYAAMDAEGPEVELSSRECSVSDVNLLSPSLFYSVYDHEDLGLREVFHLFGGPGEMSIYLADDEPADGIVDTIMLLQRAAVPGGFYESEQYFNRDDLARTFINGGDVPQITLDEGYKQDIDFWADETMAHYRQEFDIERICIQDWAE